MPNEIFDIGDHTVELLATPDETGDRYRVRIVAEPGGGPGISGTGPHIHPGLIETFTCISGQMTARLGRERRPLPPGEHLEVPPGVVHGFINAGDDPLIVDSEIIFTPPGPRPEADLLDFGRKYDALMRQRRAQGKTGDPSLLHFAVLLRAYPEAMAQPGLPGLLMRPLAWLGRLRGYTADVAD